MMTIGSAPHGTADSAAFRSWPVCGSHVRDRPWQRHEAAVHDGWLVPVVPVISGIPPLPKAQQVTALACPSGAMYLGEVLICQRGNLPDVKRAWPWLAGGVLAIGIGLTVWFTAFVLIPAGVVLIAVGITRLMRSETSASQRLNRKHPRRHTG
jgi:uncharacterized membrane protein YfcA